MSGEDFGRVPQTARALPGGPFPTPVPESEPEDLRAAVPDIAALDLAPEFEWVLRLAARSIIATSAMALDWGVLADRVCIEAEDGNVEARAWVLLEEALVAHPRSVAWRAEVAANPAPRGQRTPCPACKAPRGAPCPSWCGALPARREGEWRTCQAIVEAALARST